jgi:E3 ubiquitin-protein ligase UBR3
MFATLNPYIDLLNELCSIGTPIRKVIVDFMINEQFYAAKIDEEKKKNSKDVSADTENTATPTLTPHHSHEVYKKALDSLKPIYVPEVFSSQEREITHLTDSTMIDEFLFWCIQSEFQENLVKFLLSLLPDLRYKMVFIKSFVSKYSYISVLLLTTKAEHLSSKVVHISVQLFSNEAIAMRSLQECHLMPIVLATLYNMIVTPDGTTLLMPSQLENNSDKQLNNRNRHRVVDPDHAILHENLYWLVISDMVNLLSHRAIALAFINNSTWIELWFELIAHFQSMNLNVRQFGEHLPQDQPTYFSSFSAELEFCASIMWSMVQHLRTSEQLPVARNLLRACLERLKTWFEEIGIANEMIGETRTSVAIRRPNFRHLSFHYPLNRYYSAILYNALYLQNASLASFMSHVSLIISGGQLKF